MNAVGASNFPCLQQLYALLIEPIADILPTDPDARIIFVPQDLLFSLPFAALQDQRGTYLMETHTISVAPSIQTLAFTHRYRQGQTGTQFPGQAALIIGNPSMPTYAERPDEAPQQLPALPAAEEEATAIAALLQTEPLIGNRATKATFLSRASQATLIHLATHGLLDYTDDPSSRETSRRSAKVSELTVPGRTQITNPGALPLAPASGDSGLLTADEVALLKTNAELVVLSACDTGRGVVVSDGLLGLSRAWMVAGAPSVIASLWTVPYAPTIALMQAFYRQLVQGSNKAHALRHAMLTILPQHPDPLDWAAFTLIGEAM